MSAEFLSNFMRAAYTITRAQRSLAIDAELNTVDNIDVEESLLQSEEFIEMLTESVTTAMQTDAATISNNLIKNADDAPNTNVHLHDLRMVVTLPLGTIGAVYLDQHIRNGVFERTVIEGLIEMGRKVLANEQLNLSGEEYINLFNEIQSDK